ncbi:unnamed protein product [Peronospora farinosa]|uniref:Uncharacterized protein n=1 Tax=Peronospora farinosa TaxID=134698 RepID=A0AAV0UNP3_9STRA|nr:unnamed protein product [Peronospora farinosa]CAI5738587.1 unnamed protein product [Peronospora farinosa]
MTGEDRANRTFRSIFGDKEKRHEDVLYLELEQRDSNVSIASDAGIELALNDDDDETMWNDEVVVEDDASFQHNKTDIIPLLHSAQRKSMEEWADEDDEEENWKDALQDRVNQLELAFQHNDDALAAHSRRQHDEQQVQQLSVHDTTQCTDFSQSVPIPLTRFAAANGDSDRVRQSNRHKMQRTSSSHAWITGDNNTVTSNRPNRLWNFQRKVASGTPATMLNQNRRMRLTSIDLVGRHSQTVGHHCKRSSSLGGSTSRTESPRHLLLSENSFDNSRSSLGRSRSSSNLDGTNALPSAIAISSSRAAVFKNMSDTEAIRRFVLEDAKTMSMERLVSDAQRLHFLEGFYQNRHLTPSVTTSTAVSPSSLASSSSAMSTS